VAVRGPSVSRGLSLLPPQPNPTREGAHFEFSLAEASDVRLQIVSASGRLVRVLAAGPYPEGRHVAAWDGLDAHGARAAAGFYLVRLEAGPAHVARPLILLDR
jgi:flagellar hook assembly protein FlgD